MKLEEVNITLKQLIIVITSSILKFFYLLIIELQCLRLPRVQGKYGKQQEREKFLYKQIHASFIQILYYLCEIFYGSQLTSLTKILLQSPTLLTQTQYTILVVYLLHVSRILLCSPINHTYPSLHSPLELIVVVQQIW